VERADRHRTRRTDFDGPHRTAPPPLCPHSCHTARQPAWTVQTALRREGEGKRRAENSQTIAAPKTAVSQFVFRDHKCDRQSDPFLHRFTGNSDHRGGRSRAAAPPIRAHRLCSVWASQWQLVIQSVKEAYRPECYLAGGAAGAAGAAAAAAAAGAAVGVGSLSGRFASSASSMACGVMRPEMSAAAGAIAAPCSLEPHSAFTLLSSSSNEANSLMSSCRPDPQAQHSTCNA
jgi:hypothetical protein